MIFVLDFYITFLALKCQINAKFRNHRTNRYRIFVFWDKINYLFKTFKKNNNKRDK